MHIALNALCITNRSGTGRYAWGLIDGWMQQNDTNGFFSVWIPADFSIPKGWQGNPSFRFYSIPSHSTLQRIVWEQEILPGWLRRIQPDLIHSPAFIAPVLRSCSVLHVVTIHDLAFLRYPKTIPFLRRMYYRWIIPRSWHIADTVITDSNTVARELKSISDAPKRIVPVHLGIDEKRFSTHKETYDDKVLHRYGLSNSYFLFVGTREPRKNLSTVLDAYRSARESEMTCEFVIVGRYGWMQENTLSFPGVRWLGHVPDNDLPALYRNASALIASSVYEGYDLPPMEALACGTPVIASDIPVHREVLGDAAMYVSPTDIAGWATLFMGDLLKEKVPPRASIRDWRIVAADTMKVYQNVLRKDGSPMSTA